MSMGLRVPLPGRPPAATTRHQIRSPGGSSPARSGESRALAAQGALESQSAEQRARQAGKRPKPGWVPQGAAPSWDAEGKQAGRATGPDRCRRAWAIIPGCNGRIGRRSSEAQQVQQRSVLVEQVTRARWHAWICGGDSVGDLARWPRMPRGGFARETGHPVGFKGSQHPLRYAQRRPLRGMYLEG
jgi:hypothetical protein